MTTTPLHIEATLDRSARFDATHLMPWLVGAMVLAAGMMLVDSLPVGVVHDDGMYVILAKSLATGHGFRWLHVPGAPPATHYPPGYPAVLALLWWLFPGFPANVLVFKMANAVFSGVAAAGTARFAHRRLGMSASGAAAFSLVALLGIPTLTLSVIVMSEPLFLALLLPTLLLAERIAHDAPSGVKRRDIVLLGALCGVATLVRTHGIALIAAAPLVLALRRRYRDAVLCAAVAVAIILPWQLWVSSHSGVFPMPMRGGYESYGAWLIAGVREEGIGLLARTAARTSAELAMMFATLIAPSIHNALRYVALLMLAALAIAGVRSLWRLAPVSLLFLAFYAAIVIVWPFTPARFAWGVWPLVIALPVLGARDLLGWRPTLPALRMLRMSALAGAACVALGYATYTLRGYRGQWWQSIPRAGAANLRPLVFWAARQTAPTDLLAVEAESAVYLYTGRQTVPVHTFTVQQYFHPRSPSENAAVIRAILATYPVTAVAVSTAAMRAAARELATSHPPALAVRDTFPGGIVLTPTPR
jgi:hypothetical protein